MKRIILTLLGTVAGVVSLLSFKTSAPVASGALPSAALPDTSTSSAASSTSAASSSSTGTRHTTHAKASSTPSSSSAAATKKSYTGSAITTRYGVVQVEVTAQGTKITNVQFVQLTAFDGRSQQINAQAGPILLQETLSAQNAHIDSVSGATYTSDGYLQSLQSALDAAGIK